MMALALQLTNQKPSIIVMWNCQRSSLEVALFADDSFANQVGVRIISFFASFGHSLPSWSK